MTNREKAPGWILGGMLILIFYYAVIRLLNFMGILPVTELWVKIPNGSSHYNIITIWWIGYTLGTLFYGLITIFSIKRKWGRLVTVGGSMLLVITILWVVEMLLLQRTYVYYYEWNRDLDELFNKVASLLDTIGCILIIWGVTTTKKVKIVMTSYFCLFYLISWFPILWTTEFNLFFTVGQPLLFLGLIAFWSLSKQKI